MNWMRLSVICCLLVVSTAMVACGPPPPPEPPINIATDSNANIDGKIEFTFDIEEKNKNRVGKVKVYRDSDASGDFSKEVGEFAIADGTLNKEKGLYQFKFQDTNVLPGDKYDVKFFYKFVSISPDGKKGPMSKAFDASSSNAEAPIEVKDTKIESSNTSGGPQITVSWQANPEYDIKGYYVFRVEEDKVIKVTNVDEAASGLIAHVRDKRISWIDKTVVEGKPYWYVVVGYDKGQEVGSRKPATRFRGMVLAKAKLVAPQDGANTASPTFKWDPVDSASGYIVVILDDVVGGEVVWRSEYTTKNEVTYPSSATPLATNQTYAWYVYTYLEKPLNNKEKGNSRSDLYKFTAK